MRGRWNAIHDDLIYGISTQVSEREFKGRRTESLSRFESPLELIGHLTSKAGDPDEKNDIYFDLVRAVQGRSEWADLATSILWLGLWPALDAIYGRNFKRFARNPEELVSALCEHFTAAIGSADLSRIRRLPSTLAMNTERRLMDDIKKRWKVDARRADLPEEDRRARPKKVISALLAGRTEDQEIAALRARLLPIVGEDIDLVLGVSQGASQREAGELLGMTHDVARKRYQRAIERIRDSEESVVPFRPRRQRL